jgi:hypothetical protein
MGIMVIAILLVWRKYGFNQTKLLNGASFFIAYMGLAYNILACKIYFESILRYQKEMQLGRVEIF